MKKLLLLSLTILLFSCGDSDSINDPSLIGKWYFNTSEFFIDDSLIGIENYLANEVNGCRTYIEFKTNQSLSSYRSNLLENADNIVLPGSNDDL